MNPYVEQLMNTIFDSVDHLKTYALSFSLDPFLENTPTAVRALLQINGPFQHERVAVFMEIWGTILNRGKWVKKETELLKNAQRQEQTVERTIGLMHMDYLQKEDESLFQQLQYAQCRYLAKCAQLAEGSHKPQGLEAAQALVS
nr:hypothetical protein [Bacillus pumilus]